MSPSEIPPPMPVGKEIKPRPRSKVVLLLGILLAPPILTVSAIQTGIGGDDTATAVALIAGVLGGIAAGVLLGANIGRTPISKICLSLLLSFTFSAVCIAMSFCSGCVSGGFRMNLH